MTTTFDDLVTEVRATMRGYGLYREQVTFLNGSITNSASSITVGDGTLVRPGVVEVDSESIYVQSIAGNVLTVSPDGRGWDRTTAASHAGNARVTVNPPLPTWRIQRAINDTITGTWPTLYGVGTTTFTYNGVRTTYALPANCTGVLKVVTADPGPSRESPEIHKYSVGLEALTITLREAGLPGQTITVTYQKAPVELTTGQSLTASGLAETARPLIVYGTVARLLAFVDASRALTDTAAATELAAVTRVGTATQLSAQMTARYQLELDAEQSRLRRAHPVKVRWMGR